MNNTQYEKNPNGGYLNKSNYGADSWYGKVAITPALLAEAQKPGHILVEVKDIQTTQYGDCRRVVAKPYQLKQAPAGATPQGQAYHAPQAAPAPVQPVAAAPVAQPMSDEILF